MADFKPITTLKADWETVQHISEEVLQNMRSPPRNKPYRSQNFSRNENFFLKIAVNYIDMQYNINL